MTMQSRKGFKKREQIYRRQACGGDAERIMKTGCCGTACWYHCEKLCIEWEIKNKKEWGMHDRGGFQMRFRLENCESSSYITGLELEIPNTQEGRRVLDEYKNWYKPQRVICLQAKKQNVDTGNTATAD